MATSDVGQSATSTSEANPPIITGTIWTCSRCGNERKRRVVPADRYNVVAAMIREVSDEVLLLPVYTLNAIAERAERAERELDKFTDYRCNNGHIFSVPWGDEAPRSTVVCPVCGATAFIHFPTEGD